jgi:aryl-alcohol dehydrogenase-like predicted oxidoreductase
MAHRAVLGLGMAALGRPGYMTIGHHADVPDTSKEGMGRHAHLMLDTAWALGIRHIDTARSYGEGEAFLSQWLHERRPEGVSVSSKWGYAYTAEWKTDALVHEVKEHSVAQLKRQWPQSRALLTPWLSLYQVHSATVSSGFLEPEVLSALADLKARGVAVGLSVTGVEQAQTIRAAMKQRFNGQRLFDAVQAT